MKMVNIIIGIIAVIVSVAYLIDCFVSKDIKAQLEDYSIENRVQQICEENNLTIKTMYGGYVIYNGRDYLGKNIEYTWSSTSSIREYCIHTSLDKAIKWIDKRYVAKGEVIDVFGKGVDVDESILYLDDIQPIKEKLNR